MANGSLMKVESIAILLTCIKRELVLKTYFRSVLGVAVLHRFYCIVIAFNELHLGI